MKRKEKNNETEMRYKKIDTSEVTWNMAWHDDSK